MGEICKKNGDGREGSQKYHERLYGKQTWISKLYDGKHQKMGAGVRGEAEDLSLKIWQIQGGEMKTEQE